MKKLLMTMLVLVGLLSGCTTGTPGALGVGYPIPAFVPIINVARIPEDQLEEAELIRIYVSRDYAPEIEKELGKLEGYSVKHLLWEPSPTRDAALLQLQLRALKLGADGIVDVLFTQGGPLEVMTRDCWESIKVEGIAVQFKKTED